MHCTMSSGTSLWQRWFGKPGLRRLFLFSSAATAVSLGSGAGASKALFGNGDTQQDRAKEVASATIDVQQWLPLWMDYIRVPNSFDEALNFLSAIPELLPTPEELNAAASSLERTGQTLQQIAPTVAKTEAALSDVASAAAEISRTAKRIETFRMLTGEASRQMRAGHPLDASETLREAFAILPSTPVPSIESLEKFATVAGQIAHDDALLGTVNNDLARAKALIEEVNKFVIPIAPKLQALEESSEYRTLLQFAHNMQPQRRSATIGYFLFCFILGSFGSYAILVAGRQGRPSWLARQKNAFELFLFQQNVKKHPEFYLNTTLHEAVLQQFFNDFESGTLSPTVLRRLPPVAQQLYAAHLEAIHRENLSSETQSPKP